MTRRGWLLFLIMSVLWGIPYYLIRIAVRTVDPGVLVFGRTVVAAAIMLPLTVLRRGLPQLRQYVGWIALFGFVEFGVPWFFMGAAEQHISSSLTSLLVCTVPFLSLIYSKITKTHEDIDRRRLLGLVIGAIGVVGLVGLDVRGGNLKWIACMAVVCIGYTVGPSIMATKLSTVPGYVTVAGATSLVALAWSPLAVTHWPHHMVSAAVISIFILGAFCTAGAFLGLAEIVKEIGPNRTLVVTYVNTALAVVLGVALLHEPLTTGIMAGFPLVLIGSYFATSRRTPQA